MEGDYRCVWESRHMPVQRGMAQHSTDWEIQSRSVQGQESWDIRPFPMSVGQRTQYTFLTFFLLAFDFVTVYNRTLCCALPYSLQTSPQITGTPIVQCSVVRQMPQKAPHHNSESDRGMKPNLAFLWRKTSTRVRQCQEKSLSGI